MAHLSWLVEERDIRLDRALKQRFPQLSRQIIKEWLSRKGIKLNRRFGKAGDRLQPGDQIEIVDDLPLRPHWPGESQEPVEVLYEDEELLVLNKPPGQPCHPLHPWESGCTSQWVARRYPEVVGVGEERAPGLLHRLDNETSGVLAFARNAESYERLLEARSAGLWKKYYLAWATGEIAAPMRIQTPIAHHPSHRKKMIAVEGQQAHRSKARPCETRLWPLADAEAGATPVCVEIDVGVRHQIRVHLASIGHPLDGDPLYHPEPQGWFRLHAHRLGLPDNSGETAWFEAAPPFPCPVPEVLEIPDIPTPTEVNP